VGQDVGIRKSYRASIVFMRVQQTGGSSEKNDLKMGLNQEVALKKMFRMGGYERAGGAVLRRVEENAEIIKNERSKIV